MGGKNSLLTDAQMHSELYLCTERHLHIESVLNIEGVCKLQSADVRTLTDMRTTQDDGPVDSFPNGAKLGRKYSVDGWRKLSANCSLQKWAPWQIHIPFSSTLL